MTSAEFANREKSHWPETKPAPPRDMSGVEWLRSLRGVKLFEQFPENTRAVYLEAAKCFPDVQVFACGSRVRGDFTGGDAENEKYVIYSGICERETGRNVLPFLEFVNIARRLAGMKHKTESDFDFFIPDGRIEPTGELPKGAQRVRARVPAAELVKIPIWKKIESS